MSSFWSPGLDGPCEFLVKYSPTNPADIFNALQLSTFHLPCDLLFSHNSSEDRKRREFNSVDIRRSIINLKRLILMYRFKAEKGLLKKSFTFLLLMEADK